MKSYFKIFVMLIVVLLNIYSCDSATESEKIIVYEVISINDKPVEEYKDYADKVEVVDFPLLFFFNSITPPYEGKVLLYKLGGREFQNATFDGENYIRINVEGELERASGISFFWLKFENDKMSGTFCVTGNTVDDLCSKFEVQQR
ncbi:MAG: hypothetical protein L3J41_09530 [Melioribacteraceae bacterium]|nr:hypothetical protein [Melioribacteraceae bacterium]